MTFNGKCTLLKIFKGTLCEISIGLHVKTVNTLANSNFWWLDIKQWLPIAFVIHQYP